MEIRKGMLFYVWLPFNHFLQTKLNIQYNRKKQELL